MMKIGIVGMPNVGKSTLFNALTHQSVPAENFPFCTIAPNSAIVPVPDPRLERLAIATGCTKLWPNTIEFVDIAGLVRGAHEGVGLGNEFLANIRGVDMILHVVRAFADSNVSHVEESVDPLRDVRIVEEELAKSDIALIDKYRIAAMSRARNTNDKDAPLQFAALEKLWRAMRDEHKTAREAGLSKEQWALLSAFEFLTTKPTLFVVNVDETDTFDADAWSKRLGGKAIPLCIRTEQELGEIESQTEREELRASLGVQGSIDDVVRSCYDVLDLATFYTFGKGVTRAWPIKKGTTALEAAGMIHTDFLGSFVKAQVFDLDSVCEKGEETLRVRGQFKTIGRESPVSDGDVLWFVTN